MESHSEPMLARFPVAYALTEAPAPQVSILDGYLRRDELAKQLGVSPRTIDRWHTCRSGPPRITIGRTVLYSLESVKQWLCSNEHSSHPLQRRFGRAEGSCNRVSKRA